MREREGRKDYRKIEKTGGEIDSRVRRRKQE
jgi:hypothetical protein